MPIRAVLTKATATGEQITLNIDQCHPITGDYLHTDEEVINYVGTLGNIADGRMVDMNMRMLEAYELDKFFDIPTWQKITRILEILAGRQQAAHVAQLWRDEIEETEELERGREEAKSNVIDLVPSNGESA